MFYIAKPRKNNITLYTMNRLIRVFAVIAAVAFAASCAQEPQYANRAEKILAEINDPNSDYVVVISHRGFLPRLIFKRKVSPLSA